MTIEWSAVLDHCVDFTQRLIQTPSMPFEEAAIAAVVAAELRALGFDEVSTDAAGNVIGVVYGRDRTLPKLVLNAHLDHVDPGDPALWPMPPYSGTRQNGRIIGRGASDIKGPLATQVASIAALLRAGERPRRDVVFCAVVQEEVGGGGAIAWAQSVDYPVGLIVICEPSSNEVALGHRGIRPIVITFHGRAAHASAPHKAVNPNYALARFLTRLEAEQHTLSAHPRLGQTTVSPTVISVDTKSSNVSPAWTRIYLDFRTASDSVNSLSAFVHRLAGDDPHTLNDDMSGEALAPDDAIIVGYDTDPADPAVQRAVQLIGTGMEREATLSDYRFATDGRHFVELGAPIIGFAPGDEIEAHTAGESIRIDQIAEALCGYVKLLRDF